MIIINSTKLILSIHRYLGNIKLKSLINISYLKLEKVIYKHTNLQNSNIKFHLSI